MKSGLFTVRVSMEDGMLVAECDPFDVVAQGADLPALFYRLGVTFAAEISVAGSLDKIPRLPMDMQHKEP